MKKSTSPPGGRPKRVTETLSISLDPEAASVLRRRAARLHRGNVSAVVAELVEDARISENIAQLLETHAIPKPSLEAEENFDREMQVARRTKKRGRAA